MATVVDRPHVASGSLLDAVRLVRPFVGGPCAIRCGAAVVGSLR
jgi:hypothetical protein